MPRVVISGYYGFGNAGDEAMLTAIIQSLRRHGDFEFVVLSNDPVRTAREHGVQAVRRTAAGAIWQALVSSDALVSGGGSLLQDVTSPLTVPYYLGLIYLARMLRRRVVVYGQGIGPLHGGLARRLTRAVLNRCDLITVRDEASRRELERLGVTRPPVVVTADPVLSLEPPSPAQRPFLREARMPGKGPLVGIFPREWRGREDYKAILAKAADHLARRVKASVALIPMQNPEDTRVCEEIRGLMREPAVVLEGRHSVDDLMTGLFPPLELVVGMRLHALIFAALTGVPMVGLSYDPKIDAFLEALGQQPVGTTDALSLSEVTRRLDEAWEHRAAIRQEMIRRLRPLRERADQSAALAAEVIRGRGKVSPE